MPLRSVLTSLPDWLGSGGTKTRKLILHVGNPKCGSTTLQLGLFGQHPDIYDIHHLHKNPQRKADADRYARVLKKAIEDEDTMSGVAEEFAALCDEHRAVVYSAEGLSSEGGRPWFHKANTIEKFFDEPALADVEKKILFVYRDIHGFLWSSYRHDAIHGNKNTELGFVKWCEGQFERVASGRPSFLVGDMAERYASIAGTGNFLALELEDLIKDPYAFYSRIAKFSGVRCTRKLVNNITSNHRNSTDEKLKRVKEEALLARFVAEKEAGLPDDLREKFDTLFADQQLRARIAAGSRAHRAEV